MVVCFGMSVLNLFMMSVWFEVALGVQLIETKAEWFLNSTGT